MKTMNKEGLAKIVAKHYGLSIEDAKAKPDTELLDLVNALHLPEMDEPKAKLSGDRYRVIIHQQDGPDGNEDVVIGVNGEVAQIKREHEVALTKEQISVLENAVYIRYEPIVNRPGEYHERHIRRFNYTVLGPT